MPQNLTSNRFRAESGRCQPGSAVGCPHVSSSSLSNPCESSSQINPSAHADPLPDGPALNPSGQAFAWASRPLQFLSECAAVYGDCFTLRLPSMDPAVIFSHPEAIREIFRGDPMTLHAGRGNAILEPVLGASS